jgi:hypothetical protein
MANSSTKQNDTSIYIFIFISTGWTFIWQNQLKLTDALVRSVLTSLLLLTSVRMSNSNISIRAFKYYKKLYAINCMQYLVCDMLHV